MRTDKDFLTVSGASARLLLTSMRLASMMGVPLEISGRESKPELERPRAATHSASGFFHGLASPLWAAGREEPQGSPALYRSSNFRSVAHPFRSGSAVPYRT